MPRNLDPKIADIPNVELYHIDDLERVVQQNLEKRRNAINEVEKIIEDKLEEYSTKLDKAQEIALAQSSEIASSSKFDL